jgi:three-Cys-motif partner protein
VTQDFFKAKRPWSKYKDFILGYYLEPYIPKVATLKKPILVVDCFAGCGRFGDGEPGSPLIIAPIIKKWRDKGLAVSGEFIEADPENFRCLSGALQEYREFAMPRLGVFDDLLPELAEKARQNTVFLYVDPYTVKGLDFARMKAVYDQIRRASASVELLLNLNVATFLRWGLAALKAKRMADDLAENADSDEADYQADNPNESVELTTLDSIAGGDYWREIANDGSTPFPEKLRLFTQGYLRQLVSSFTFAAAYEVKSKYEHRVPKYALVYGTRHPDGVELMNDAMCKARLDVLGKRFSTGMLFDMTPDEEKPDFDKLYEDLVSFAKENGPLTRKALRNKAIWKHFGTFESKDVNKAIGNLLKSQRLFSSTGKVRINDDVRLSPSSFATAERSS